MYQVHQALTLLFWPKKRMATDSNPVIYVRITVNNQRVEISTGISIGTSLWDQKAQKVTGKTEMAKTVNTQLSSIVSDINKNYSILTSLEKVVTAELLKNAYLGIGPKPRSLCEAFDFHIHRFEQKVSAGKKSPGSLQRFKIAKAKVMAFMKSQYGVSDKKLFELKYSFIADFEHYLTAIERSCYNTATKYLKILKQVAIVAVEQEWIAASPFQTFKCTYEESVRHKLTMQEISAMYSKELASERLREVRDVYLFCCYTGFAYQDVYNLKPTDIVIGIDDELWIIKNRIKTDHPEKVPLLPIALEILDRYKQHPYCLTKGCLLPVNSNQKYNEYLKEIAEVCGIRKTLTTHTARHTFATTVTLEHDVPLETVSQMLGHKSVKTTQIYAKISQRKISNNMKELKNRLAKQNKPS
ncbi:tyrosine-type recombinase/integrase [Chitinophagaceae bacterium 26-R-25]|nr:tyrosine-type recombinase/integrase [Chitinophagaceae bacterium 26-R-25]